jgi:replicative DNA helicase
VKANSEILDRQPPSNLEAERGVLGSILLLPTVCDDVAMILRPEVLSAHRTLYTHLRAMNDEERRIDTTLLVDRLKSSGRSSVAGPPYLVEVLRSAPGQCGSTPASSKKAYGP